MVQDLGFRVEELGLRGLGLRVKCLRATGLKTHRRWCRGLFCVLDVGLTVAHDPHLLHPKP